MSQFYRHNDTLYLVIRRIPHFMFHKRDGEYLQDLFLEWKEKLKADHVLKDQTHYMFCHTIEDAVYEDILEETILVAEAAEETVEETVTAAEEKTEETAATDIEEPILSDEPESNI